MSKENSGTKSAEELRKLEEDLDTIAGQGEPSEDNDNTSKKPASKEEDEEDIDEDEEDENTEDDDDSDEEDDIDSDVEDEDEDNGETKDDKKTPAWKQKMQERRAKQATKQAISEALSEFEEKHGRKATKEEKASMEDDLDSDFESEFGIKPDAQTKKFIDWIEKRTAKKTGLTPELTARLERIEKDTVTRAEQIGYENDFSKQKKLLDKLFPNLNEKTLSRLKEKVKELAYTEKYQKYPLEDIIRLNRKALTPVERRKTGEASRGGHGQARYTADNIDPEKIDWKALSVEEADKLMTQLEKQQVGKSRMKIFRKGKQIN